MKLKPFECVFCKSLFSRNSSLKYHIRSIHTQLVNADGQLSEQAVQQLQILRDAVLSTEEQAQEEMLSMPANARKERGHPKSEEDSSQVASAS